MNYPKQNNNVNVDRVESGIENQEADIITNVGFTKLTAMQKQMKSSIVTNLVVTFCYTTE